MLKAMTLTLENITMQDCNRDMHDKNYICKLKAIHPQYLYELFKSACIYHLHPAVVYKRCLKKTQP